MYRFTVPTNGQTVSSGDIQTLFSVARLQPGVTPEMFVADERTAGSDFPASEITAPAAVGDVAGLGGTSADVNRPGEVTVKLEPGAYVAFDRHQFYRADLAAAMLAQFSVTQSACRWVADARGAHLDS